MALVTSLMPFAAPANAGPPFRTDDPEPVEFGHVETDLFSLGTRTTSISNGILPGLEVDYGVAPNLKFSTIIPLAYASQEDAPNGVALGDIGLSAKYRFIVPAEGSWMPQAAFDPAVVLPVGNQKFGSSTGHVQVFLPLWLQKDFGPWTVYGGGGYWLKPGAGNRNYGFVGAALWRKATDHLNLGVEVFHQTPPASTVKASTRFDVGVIYDLSETWHVLGSARTGLQNRRETNLVSYYVAVNLSFCSWANASALALLVARCTPRIGPI